MRHTPRIHLVNPSTQSFGVAVITPRWLYVLAAATGSRCGDPQIVDETLEAIDLDAVSAGDIVGIGDEPLVHGLAHSVVRGASAVPEDRRAKMMTLKRLIRSTTLASVYGKRNSQPPSGRSLNG